MAIGKIIAVIAGVAVGGITAYNFTTTGCMLGSCGAEKAAAVQPVSSVAEKGDCCPTTTGCPLCPDAAADKAVVTEVALTEQTGECSMEPACSRDDASTCSKGESCCKAAATEVAEKADSAEKPCCAGKTEAEQVAAND